MSFSRIIVICITGGAILTWDPAHSQNQPETLRATERERLRALVDADMETAYQLHAEDFQLITPLGAALSREQYLGQIASGEIDYLAWEPGEVEVKLFGNVAVIRYQAALRIVVKGLPNAPSGSFWHTDLYERRKGGWQVVWSQATQIQTARPPPTNQSGRVSESRPARKYAGITEWPCTTGT